VQHGVNGFLVPPKDPGALAEAIETLLRDPERRIQFGVASRQLAEEKEAVEQYGSSDSGASLGDILGEALRRQS
ncbi:MAG: glycosyltransferase, partial [Novosphingobium sp.]|nr:glycosyltransferase [Novosphingobium sp.]